jgi:hypothetical protein
VSEVTELASDESELVAELKSDEREEARDGTAPVAVEMPPLISEVTELKTPPWPCAFVSTDRNAVFLGRTHHNRGGKSQSDDVLELHSCGLVWIQRM